MKWCRNFWFQQICMQILSVADCWFLFRRFGYVLGAFESSFQVANSQVGIRCEVTKTDVGTVGRRLAWMSPSKNETGVQLKGKVGAKQWERLELDWNGLVWMWAKWRGLNFTVHETIPTASAFNCRWCLYLFRLPAPVMMTTVMDRILES